MLNIKPFQALAAALEANENSLNDWYTPRSFLKRITRGNSLTHGSSEITQQDPKVTEDAVLGCWLRSVL